MSGPYRILYHHRTQALDGQRVHIHEIQRALRALGHDVVEIAPLAATETAGSDASRSLARRVIEWVAARTPAAMYEIAELVYNVPAYLRLSAAIRRTRPDFIYERYSLNTVAGVWAARRYRIPLLLEVNSPLADEKQHHGRLAFHGVARRIERYVVTQATRTLAVTGVLKDRLVRATGVADHRVVVVQNGVDPERFAAAERRRNEIRFRLGVGREVVVGAVGFFRDWHGIDRLVEAMHAERRLSRGVRLLLVGDGPALPGVRERARELGVADRVILSGSVPHGEVPALVAAMDVVMIPHVVEYASPLKLFEYMAAGKAIVAPRQPNVEEVLTNDADALLFAPHDNAAFRLALVQVASSPELRGRIGRAARQTIERRDFTWNGNAARIVRVFEEECGPRTAAGVLRSSHA
jgi:glycosyltransferase involved in cell wall biosynthesis